jgi:hypothetical protein
MTELLFSLITLSAQIVVTKGSSNCYWEVTNEIHRNAIGCACGHQFCHSLELHRFSQKNAGDIRFGQRHRNQHLNWYNQNWQAGSFAQLDALTSTTSHELCEAITDPIPGEGWYDDANGEIGDICAWKTKKLGNYTVQLEWSNRGDKCL